MNEPLTPCTRIDELQALYSRLKAALMRNDKSEAEVLFTQYYKLFYYDPIDSYTSWLIKDMFEYDARTILDGLFFPGSIFDNLLN